MANLWATVIPESDIMADIFLLSNRTANEDWRTASDRQKALAADNSKIS